MAETQGGSLPQKCPDCGEDLYYASFYWKPTAVSYRKTLRLKRLSGPGAGSIGVDHEGLLAMIDGQEEPILHRLVCRARSRRK